MKYDLHHSLRIREIEGTRTKRNAMRIFKCKHRHSMFLLSQACVMYHLSWRMEFMHREMFNPFLVRGVSSFCTRRFFRYKEAATPNFSNKKSVTFL